ncbi:unnamed protein product [Nippostrongylus brasiliensis]|uniref:Glycogen phosphorylase n=1 Tax=Nippostrongylus brasiliensis TaxID=27835 RepID=A0A0N4YDZ9_NIPBR|nr:unnamed protein product [Nippostrongylus brasiliensis]
MPKYKLASCLIQKNMATVQVSTYCYLENPAEFHAQNKSIQSMWWGDSEVGWLNEIQRCFGCLDDLRCFLDAVYRLLVDYQAGKINRMTNMAEYYITHFAPQTW